jgi:hypothetical protein
MNFKGERQPSYVGFKYEPNPFINFVERHDSVYIHLDQFIHLLVFLQVYLMTHTHISSSNIYI